MAFFLLVAFLFSPNEIFGRNECFYAFVPLLSGSRAHNYRKQMQTPETYFTPYDCNVHLGISLGVRTGRVSPYRWVETTA